MHTWDSRRGKSSKRRRRQQPLDFAASDLLDTDTERGRLGVLLLLTTLEQPQCNNSLYPWLLLKKLVYSVSLRQGLWLVHDAQLQERSAFGCRICALVIQTVVPASRVTKMPLQQELTMRNYIVLYAPELAQAENYLSLTFA